MALLNSFNVPAPRWYRIVKKVWAATENIFIGVWLLTGHTQDSTTLLIFKLVSSQLKDTLDGVLTNGTEYAPAGTSEALKKITDTDSAKEGIQQVFGTTELAPKPEHKQ